MNNLLYPKLAWKNIRSNGKFYFPYLLTIAGVAAAFYITYAMAFSPDVPATTRYAYLSSYMMIGIFVIGLFSVIFLFYTNSFLMKRRNKELGLYNILGMGKLHIGKVLCWETVYTALIGITGGVIVGALLQKLVTLLALRMIGVPDAPYGFYVSAPGILVTFLFFSAILFLNLLFNLNRIRITNPAELLRGNSTGEREPRTKWILALLGVVSLGVGYWIAVVTKSALDAISYYFVAVFLVIIGTYCLFTAGSIAVLKLLRKNKGYYYRTKHFISVSGMLYRMKRNAVGLANICILSTMVLVMVSGTLALFIGTKDALHTRCPADISVEVSYIPGGDTAFDADAFGADVRTVITAHGLSGEHERDVRYLAFTAGRANSTLLCDTTATSVETAGIIVLSAGDYAAYAGAEAPVLSADEVLHYSARKNSLDGSATFDFKTPENPDGQSISFHVTESAEPFLQLDTASPFISEIHCFIVPDEATLYRIYENQALAYGKDASTLTHLYLTDVSGSDEEETACAGAIKELVTASAGDNSTVTSVVVESRAAVTEDMYSVNGGFFFLGIFLGIIFTMALVLIIYYKQITEGYEDRDRYRIMEQVGLDRKTVRKSVNAQLLTVFFLPLLASVVHICFNFRLMRILLSLFQLYSVTPMVISTLITIGLFMVIYSVVYLLTARTYYRIVS